MTAVYLLDTELFQDPGLCAAVRASLSPQRQEKISAYRFEKDRRLSLGAGAALDCALHTAGLREQDAALHYGPNGKPFLQNRHDLHFNLSHSGRYAVCALSSRPVGVDVEQIGSAEESLLRRICTRTEADRLLSLDSGLDRQFFQLWTVKESYMKLLGTGLSLAPERLEVRFAPAATICLDGAPQPAVFRQKQIDGHWLTVCTEEPEEVSWVALSRADLVKMRESSAF